MVRWSLQDRRRRLLDRHHLRPERQGRDLPALCRDLVGLHATDPVSVYLQARARLDAVTSADVEQALYEDRTVARVLAMRRTMFLVVPADVPVLQAAVTDKLADRELRRTAKWVEEAEFADDGEEWVRRAAHDTLSALAEHGPMTALQLRELVPALARQIVVNRGKAYEGKMGMSTRVLFWLATTGEIVRGRPGGGMASTNWQWARTTDWLGAEASAAVDVHDAAVELARRYLRAFGPATFDDLQWWTGWTKTLTRQALATLRPDEVTVDAAGGGDVTALVVPGDGEPVEPGADDAGAGGSTSPVVNLLPALDATPMGWKDRRWFMGRLAEFSGPLFDRNGNVGPTVWVDGQVVGGWGQRPDGEIAWRVLADEAVDEALVAAAADDLRAWLGDVRFTSAFPTPWYRELSAP